MDMKTKAKGRIVDVLENHFKDDDWHLNKKKIFIINGKMKFSSYPYHHVQIEKDDGEYIWFSDSPEKRDYPKSILEQCPDYIPYYKIEKQVLLNLGWVSIVE